MSAPGRSCRNGRLPCMQAIIDVLQADGRATPERIAVMTGLEVEVVREQIEAWEREGVIRRYKAVIDPGRLRAIAGTELVTALIDVSVSPERGVGFDAVAARIARLRPTWVQAIGSRHEVDGKATIVAGCNLDVHVECLRARGG